MSARTKIAATPTHPDPPARERLREVLDEAAQLADQCAACAALCRQLLRVLSGTDEDEERVRRVTAGFERAREALEATLEGTSCETRPSGVRIRIGTPEGAGTASEDQRDGCDAERVLGVLAQAWGARHDLTEKETEVFHTSLMGLSREQIAARLGRKIDTVGKHAKSILDKSRGEAREQHLSDVLLRALREAIAAR